MSSFKCWSSLNIKRSLVNEWFLFNILYNYLILSDVFSSRKYMFKCNDMQIYTFDLCQNNMYPKQIILFTVIRQSLSYPTLLLFIYFPFYYYYSNIKIHVYCKVSWTSMFQNTTIFPIILYMISKVMRISFVFFKSAVPKKRSYHNQWTFITFFFVFYYPVHMLCFYHHI